MASRRPGSLGKGLGALIPELAKSSGLLQVPVESIGPNPRQPRGAMRQESLQELADSIREHGMLQPLVVSRNDEREGPAYRLIAGERRWRAARLGGLASVPVVVKEATEQGLLELALIENIQRADLHALEEASAYRQLIEEFGLTQEAVARRVGRARTTVANALRLLEAPKPIQDALAGGSITEGHARALLGATGEPARVALLRRVVDGGLSVRQTEELVRQVANRSAERASRTEPPERSPVEEQLERALGTR